MDPRIPRTSRSLALHKALLTLAGGIALGLGLLGLAGRNMLGADLSGEVLRGDLAVAVHQDDQRSGVLVLHDERLDHMMMINPAGRGGQRRTAVLDVFVGLFLKGNVVLPEPLGGGVRLWCFTFELIFYLRAFLI